MSDILGSVSTGSAIGRTPDDATRGEIISDVSAIGHMPDDAARGEVVTEKHESL